MQKMTVRLREIVGNKNKKQSKLKKKWIRKPQNKNDVWLTIKAQIFLQTFKLFLIFYFNVLKAYNNQMKEKKNDKIIL